MKVGKFVIEDETSFNWCWRALHHPSAKQRLRAARTIAAYRSAAVPHLCAALRDTDREVIAAAAESLGRIGSPVAIRPLMKALRDTFTRRKPWLQVLVGIGFLIAFFALGWVAVAVSLLAFVVVVVFWILFVAFLGFMDDDLFEFALSTAFGALRGIGGFLEYAFAFFHYRRDQNRHCMTILKALMKIAERSPSPELRMLLSDLDTIAADFVQQDPATRHVAKDVRRRIVRWTDRIKHLPAPASAPCGDMTQLPRPASAGTTLRASTVVNLPRVPVGAQKDVLVRLQHRDQRAREETRCRESRS